MTVRTCACGAEFTCQPWSPKRFCSAECAWESRRCPRGPMAKLRTPPELALRIVTLLSTDPHAWERFRKLMRGQA